MTRKLRAQSVRATIVAVGLLFAFGLIAPRALAQPGEDSEFDPFESFANMTATEVLAPAPAVDAGVYYDPLFVPVEPWQLQILPEGLIFRSYMAGVHEARMSGTVFHEKDIGSQLDVTLGGRIGMVRVGTTDAVHPEGWQLDVEGAAFPRLNLDASWDLDAIDFRVGVPLTYGVGNIQTKFGYYHLSSHLGDEFIIRNPGSVTSRINYSRDTLIAAVSVFPYPVVRLYAEAGWAFYSDGGSRPWEFQFGTDVSQPGVTGTFGTPFLAINGHLREEVDFGGNLVVQAGWLWRGASGRVLRTGLHYYNGKSNQFEFFSQSEQQIGWGLWHEY